MPVASYTIPFFSLDSANVNIAGILEQFRSGEQWDWHAASNPTLAIDAVNTTYHAQITDTANGLFDDDSAAGTQTLAADITDEFATMLWSAGSVIEDEYEIELTDGDGTTYRLVAISIDDTIVGFTFEGAVPPIGTTLTYTFGNSSDIQVLDPADAVVCFTADALIVTARGEVAAGRLKDGDMVLTRDNGFQPLRRIGRRQIPSQDLFRAPHLRPIRISAGALGPGIPRRDLLVSPQHRILVRSRLAIRMFGENEILVAARNLTALPGVEIDVRVARVTYVHLLFDAHQVIYANSAPCESLYSGAMALAIVTRDTDAGDRNAALDAVLDAAFDPEHIATSPARLVATGRRSRKLAERLVKNGKHLLDRSAG